MRMMNLRPHREILLTAFRQGWRDNGRWVIALLALLCIVPNVAAWWFQPAEAARLVTLCTAAALLQALWIAQFVSVQQQNHPTAARLVPGHVQHLRESLVAVFIAISLATAALLGSALGHALAWGLGTGALSCYARPSQEWTYYEIDPAVERIARTHFTFLNDCLAPLRPGQASVARRESALAASQAPQSRAKAKGPESPRSPTTPQDSQLAAGHPHDQTPASITLAASRVGNEWPAAASAAHRL